MRKIFSFSAIFLFAILFFLFAFVTLAIEAQPRINRQIILTPAHIERAKQIIDTHHNQLTASQFSIAKIHTQDADIAANYLANHFTNGSAQISISSQKAHVLLSLPLPKYFILKGYLNFEASLIQTSGLPQLQSVHIGNLALPDFLTSLLMSQLISWLQNQPDVYKGLNAIKLVEISPKKITIMYRRWNNNSLTQEILAPLLSKNAQAQIYRYHKLLVNKSRQGKTTALSEILPPLMRVAAKYSANGDPLAENRAVILATTFQVLEIPLELLISDAATWPRANNLSVTLEGRTDFAKHFIASAAITVYTDTKLSNAIGLYKEISDSKTGSGFSFNDIAASLAGTRFGQKAVKNKVSALQLQQLVAAGLNDTDLMPPWSDLPEHMSETEFKVIFGDTNTITYQEMIHEIESRILMLRILR